MAARDITPDSIRDVLESSRQARSFAPGPLGDLHIVRERLRRAGRTISPADLEWALADLLVDTICQTLGRLREAEAPPDPAALTPEQERAWLRADIADRDIECQAWACLYQRYVSHTAPSIARIAQELGAGTAARRLVQRRIARGMRRLAQRLVEQEWQAVEAATRRHDLPHLVDRTVGRHRERAHLAEQLESVRLITLVGPGGIGKTRLAIEAARAAASRFLDGACWIDLAPSIDPAGLHATIAAATDVRLSGTAEPAEEIVAGLRERQALLVMDNCEHLGADVAATVDEMLRGCRDLAILATSRRPLGARGERVVEVTPLSVPGQAAPAATTSTDGTSAGRGESSDPVELAVRASDAGVLFLERAAAVDPLWRPSATLANAVGLEERQLPGQRAAGDWAAVAEICRRLEGIPLAIEMAAARLRGLPVTAVAEGLDDVLRLLTGGVAGTAERHATMGTVIEWSWRLLSEPERRLLARLSVFRGAFEIASAEAVCGDEDAPRAVTRDRLARLVDASLVVRLSGGRYRLLEPVREYAVEMLSGSGESERVRDGHLSYFATWTQAGRSRGHGAETHDWFDCIDARAADLDHALAWAADEGNVNDGAAMCDNLIEFWDTRGHYRPALRWTESLLSRAHQSGSLQSRAMLVRATAKAAGLRGKFGRQRDLAQELLTIADALDDPFYRAEAHRQHGTAQVFLGDLESARSDFSVVIGLRRLQEDEALLADAILNLAVVDDMAGKHELAIAGYEDAQRRYRHLGHTQGLCKTTNNLAALLEDARRFDEAFVLRQEALSLARGIQLRSTEALSLEALGTHYGRRGEIDKAFDCNLQALAIYRQIGDPRGQTAMLNNLADTCLAREQLRSAASFLADACELLPDHPDLAHEEFVFGTASKVLRRSGRQEAGLRFLIASIELHRRRQYQHERHLRRNEDRLDKLRDSFDPSTFARIREDGKTLANDPGAALGALRELLSSPGVVVDDSSV